MTSTLPVAVDELVVGAPPELPAQRLLELYTVMSRIRAFEDEVVSAFKAGLIPGSTHPCIGQIAVRHQPAENLAGLHAQRRRAPLEIRLFTGLPTSCSIAAATEPALG